MKYQEIIKQIDKKKFSPIYLLTGEEPYYIDKISNYISKNTLSEEEKEFNEVILYGKDTNINSIINESKQFPFGSKNRIVIVKEAQNVKSLEDLNNYAKNPNPSTILVICYKYKKLDRRKKKIKDLINHSTVFESNPVYQNQIPKWIQNYIKELGYQIDEKSCFILSEYLGNNLSKISNEIGKIIINIQKEQKISPRLIEENIGISKDFNIYELQDALGKKDIFKSNQIIKHFSENPKNHPIVLTISSLFSYFQKILIYHSLSSNDQNFISQKLGVHPFFIKQYQMGAKNYKAEKIFSIFSYLKEYDLKSKGINNPSLSEKDLLKELTFKILH